MRKIAYTLLVIAILAIGFVIGAVANGAGNRANAETSALKSYSVTYTSGAHGYVCAHSMDEVKSWHGSIAYVDHDYQASHDAACAGR